MYFWLHYTTCKFVCIHIFQSLIVLSASHEQHSSTHRHTSATHVFCLVSCTRPLPPQLWMYYICSAQSSEKVILLGVGGGGGWRLGSYLENSVSRLELSAESSCPIRQDFKNEDTRSVSLTKDVLWSIRPAHHSQTKYSVLTIDLYYLNVYGGRERERELNIRYTIH